MLEVDQSAIKAACMATTNPLHCSQHSCKLKIYRWFENCTHESGQRTKNAGFWCIGGDNVLQRFSNGQIINEKYGQKAAGAWEKAIAYDRMREKANRTIGKRAAEKGPAMTTHTSSATPSMIALFGSQRATINTRCNIFGIMSKMISQKHRKHPTTRRLHGAPNEVTFFIHFLASWTEHNVSVVAIFFRCPFHIVSLIFIYFPCDVPSVLLQKRIVFLLSSSFLCRSFGNQFLVRDRIERETMHGCCVVKTCVFLCAKFKSNDKRKREEKEANCRDIDYAHAQAMAAP